MSKFKPGDIIIGNKKANRYVFTHESWIGRVVSIHKKDCTLDGTDIVVINLNGGAKFSVESECFDLFDMDALNHKTDIDWNKFAQGELEVKVNKEKFPQFIEQCKEHNLSLFETGIDNPWDEYDALPDGAKALAHAFHVVPGDTLWFIMISGHLKWSTRHNEEFDECEFI